MSYWIKTYGLGHIESITLDKNGDILAAGDLKPRRGFITRIDAKGHPLWGIVNSGSKRSKFFDIKVAPNGDILVAGEYDNKPLILRIDPNGKVKWAKIYGRKFTGSLYSLAISPEDSIVTVGTILDKTMVILKLTGDGEVIWHKSYSDTVGKVIAVTPNGEIIVVGGKIQQDKTPRGYSVSPVLIKFKPNGNVVWKKEYNVRALISYLNPSFISFSLALFSSGEMVLTNSKITLKLDADGNVIWARDIGGNAIVTTPRGDIVLANDTRITVLSGDNGEIKGSKVIRERVPILLGKSLVISDSGDIILPGKVSLDNRSDESKMCILRLPSSIKLPGIFQECQKITCENVPVGVSPIRLEKVEYSKIRKRLHATVRMGMWPLKEKVVYDDLDPSIVEFWELLSKGRLEDAAKLFEELYPKISDNLITLFVPDPLLLLEDSERYQPRKALIAIENPYLSSLGVFLQVELSKPRSFGFTLAKGESWMKLLELGAGERLPWVQVEFKPYHTKLSRYFEKVKHGEVLKALSQVCMDSQNVIEFLLKEGLSQTELREYLIYVLKNSISVSIPEMVEDIESEITVSFENTIFDNIELEIAIPNKFLEIRDSIIKFPKLKKGEKVKKSIEVKPITNGKFDIPLKILAKNIEINGDNVKLNIDFLATEKRTQIVVNEDPNPVNRISVSVPDLVEGKKALLKIDSKTKRPFVITLEDPMGLLKFSDKWVMLGFSSRSKSIGIIPKAPGNTNILLHIETKIKGSSVTFQKIIPVEIKENPDKELILDAIKFQTPPLLLRDQKASIIVKVHNTVFDSLEVDVEFPWISKMEIHPKTLHFQKVERDQWSEPQTVTIVPKFTGRLDLQAKIKAIINGDTKLNCIQVIPLTAKENLFEKNFIVDVPELIEETPSLIRITIENTIADPIKIILDLSKSEEFFEFERTVIEFPELKSGQKISKSITVSPKYAGEFDLNIKIKAIMDKTEIETSKTVPVKVLDKVTYLHSRTPSPEFQESVPYQKSSTSLETSIQREFSEAPRTEAMKRFQDNSKETYEELYRGKVVFKIGSFGQERTGTLVITKKVLKLEGKYSLGGMVATIPIKAALRVAGVGEIHEEVPLDRIRFPKLVKNALLSSKYHVEFIVDDRKFFIYTDAAPHIYNILKKYAKI